MGKIVRYRHGRPDGERGGGAQLYYFLPMFYLLSTVSCINAIQK